MSKEARQNSNYKIKIRKYKYNSKGTILFLNLNIFKFLIFLINIIGFSYEIDITLKVNGIGNQQIISDAYNISENYPYRIMINGEAQVQILRDNMVYVGNYGDKIQLKWTTTHDNFSYMFANITSIISATLNNINSPNANFSHMFYNCTNLQNFSTTTFYNGVSDTSYMFYNCYSLINLHFDKIKFSNYINLSHTFYNCSNLDNFTEFNFGTAKIYDMKYSFYNCTSLTTIDFHVFPFINSICADLSHAFYNCYKLSSIKHENVFSKDISYIFYNNTSFEQIKININKSCPCNMSYSFYDCINLTTIQNYISGEIDPNDPWSIAPNDARSMFYNCISLTSLKLELKYDSNEINMTRMFYNCNDITQIELLVEASKNYYYRPNDMHAMFFNCINLTNVQLNNFKTEKVLDMSFMFYNCINLIEFKRTGGLFSNDLTTNMRGMFENCRELTSIDLSDFETPMVAIMWAMFKDCSKLSFINIDNKKFDTSQVTDMESMFEGCSSLTSLILEFNTSKVQYMNKMFKDCTSLEELNFSTIDASSMGTMHQMFYNCNNLTYLNLYNLSERGQSIIEMFNNVNSSFVFCIKENENIPTIFDVLVNDLPYTVRDCSDKCYGESNERLEVTEKKYCCAHFIYDGNCYDICPPKTTPNESNICNFFDCPNYYNYYQNECIYDIPEGFYVNDTLGKTIDKCHENCTKCRGRGVDGDTNCTACSGGWHLYRRNCYKDCKYGYLMENPNECQCFEERCYKCSDDSLEHNLCISCNENKGYFKKSDETAIYGFYDCYNEPEKYYFDRLNRKYKPCFNSCLFCTSGGNYNRQLCKICDPDFSFAIYNDIDEGTEVYNCYPNCTFYYYFDNSNVYQCTEENKCPDDFGKLINGTRECVKNCPDLLPSRGINQTMEYRKTCYKDCPVDNKLLIREGHLCRARCPNIDEPFEMVDEQICVPSCTIEQRVEEKCITNYFGNKSDEEVQDKVLSYILNDIIDTFNYTYIDENTSVLIKEDNDTHIYEIISTDSKVRNPLTSTVLLKDCERTLKSYYGIDQSEPLIMLKLDAYREGQAGPTVEYQLYYSFNKRKLEQLDLTVCEGEGISILIDANMTEGEEDFYNKKSGYYNDICYTFTSDSGTDMTLQDRQNEFADNNKSLCEAGCDFVKYHANLKQAECNCEVKTNLNLVSDISVDKSKLYDFMDIKKIANFDVMKCYNLITTFDGLKTNIGFYCFIPAFLTLFISLIIFYCKEFKAIKRQINEIVFAKMNLTYMDIEAPKPKPKEVKPKFIEPIFKQILDKKKKNAATFERKGKEGGVKQTIKQTKSNEKKIEKTENQINKIENKIQININLPENYKQNKKKLVFSDVQEIKELPEEEEPKKSKKNKKNNLKKKNKKKPKKKKKKKKIKIKTSNSKKKI